MEEIIYNYFVLVRFQFEFYFVNNFYLNPHVPGLYDHYHVHRIIVIDHNHDYCTGTSVLMHVQNFKNKNY